MNWDMLSAVGELGGVAVVIISLLDLSRQVKMSKQLARPSSSTLRSGTRSTQTSKPFTNPRSE